MLSPIVKDNKALVLNWFSALPKQVLLVTHRDPDGDALGSCLAMQEALRHQGHQVTIWSHAYRLLPSHAFFPGIDTVCASLPRQNWDTLLLLDCGSLSRVSNSSLIPSIPMTSIVIDHHEGYTPWAHFSVVEPSVSSVGELLASLFIEWKWPITPSMATCLYAAIAFDTGRFLFQNTSANTLRTAAYLSDCGADTAGISLQMFQNLSQKNFNTMKDVLNRTVVLSDIGLVYCSLPKQSWDPDFKAVDLIRQMEGMDIAAGFIETENGEIKVNLRSKKDFSVLAIATQFNGGGHLRAAGMTVSGQSLETVIDTVVAAIRRSVLSAT